MTQIRSIFYVTSYEIIILDSDGDSCLWILGNGDLDARKMKYPTSADLNSDDVLDKSIKLLDFCFDNDWDVDEMYTVTTTVLSAILAGMGMDEEDMRIWCQQMCEIVKKRHKELERQKERE